MKVAGSKEQGYLTVISPLFNTLSFEEFSQQFVFFITNQGGAILNYIYLLCFWNSMAHWKLEILIELKIVLFFFLTNLWYVCPWFPYTKCSNFWFDPGKLQWQKYAVTMWLCRTISKVRHKDFGDFYFSSLTLLINEFEPSVSDW